jgi:hypothetical protein
MELQRLDNGNLKFIITSEEMLELIDDDGKRSDEEILFDLLEVYFGNGFHNLTGQVGLTDSPIIGEDWDLTDDGFVETESSKTWFLPDYMVTDYVVELLKNGYIEFQLAK